MILIAYRHGLRAPELPDLRWDRIDFAHAVLHVRRLWPAAAPAPQKKSAAQRQQRQQPLVAITARLRCSAGIIARRSPPCQRLHTAIT
jgi:hypothetical protein